MSEIRGPHPGPYVFRMKHRPIPLSFLTTYMAGSAGFAHQRLAPVKIFSDRPNLRIVRGEVRWLVNPLMLREFVPSKKLLATTMFGKHKVQWFSDYDEELVDMLAQVE